MPAWFNTRKAAQVVAFFAREQGGSINVLKLTKLVYIADRTHMRTHDFPILADSFVSMNHGPVNSVTYEFVNGSAYSGADWEAFVTDRANHEVGATSPNFTDAELDELSRAELRTLHEVWGEFGKMGKWEIRDWTHDNCPEWEDPHGSSAPIPYERVFKFLGKTNADELEARVMEDRKLRITIPIQEDRPVTSSLPTTFLSEIAEGDHVISENTLAYLQERAKMRLYDYIVRKFLEREEDGLTRAQLARRIGKSPEIVTRLLGAPGNWTIETVADLLVGIASEELKPDSESLIDRPKRNYAGAFYTPPQQSETEAGASIFVATEVPSLPASRTSISILVTNAP